MKTIFFALVSIARIEVTRILQMRWFSSAQWSDRSVRSSVSHFWSFRSFPLEVEPQLAERTWLVISRLQNGGVLLRQKPET